jgi:hypothetical protein
MSSEDATYLLFSLASGALAKDAPSAARTYAKLPFQYNQATVSQGRTHLTVSDYKVPLETGALRLGAIDKLPLVHPLFEIVDSLIFSAQLGRLAEAVGDRKPRGAPFSMVGTTGWSLGIRLEGPEPTAEVRLDWDNQSLSSFYGYDSEGIARADLVRSAYFSHKTVMALGQLLRGQHDCPQK